VQDPSSNEVVMVQCNVIAWTNGSLQPSQCTTSEPERLKWSCLSRASDRSDDDEAGDPCMPSCHILYSADA
jgi:hypothetical protein